MIFSATFSGSSIMKKVEVLERISATLYDWHLPIVNPVGVDNIRLSFACLKISLSITVGMDPESIMSLRTIPAPTEGNWSTSPTRISVASFWYSFEKLVH